LRVTPTARPAAVPAAPASSTPHPVATSIVHETCLSDPALWTLVPYSQPGAESTTLHVVDRCVMEQVEHAFAEYVDARAERGRYWTAEDDARYFSSATGLKKVRHRERG